MSYTQLIMLMFVGGIVLVAAGSLTKADKSTKRAMITAGCVMTSISVLLVAFLMFVLLPSM